MNTVWQFDTSDDLALSPAARLRSARRETGILGAAVGHCLAGVQRLYLSLFQNLHVEGLEHLPLKPPFVLVANHSSHLDTVILHSLLPSRVRSVTYPLGAADTFFRRTGKALGAIAMTNVLPLDRERPTAESLDALRQRLQRRQTAFVLYPEGTRSRDGTIAMFRMGVGRLVAGLDVPVVPCFIGGTRRVMPPGTWWPRRGDLCVRIGPGRVFVDAPDALDSHQQIAGLLQRDVERLGRQGTGSGS